MRLSRSPAHAAAMSASAGSLDGATLHATVPPDRWCVTRADIADFGRIVRRAVLLGEVVPTNMDDFSPHTGPNIYTVTAQLIKPVTARCGNASWALMLHPEGLLCDLFITHAWSEGAFEFVDKVLHSWPRRARNAYCCMLSNPQNLDITSLVRDPLSSPFAIALRAAKIMLVVPNDAGSIYTRIWCVYEAFLSQSWNKPIFTATSPIPGLWRYVGALMLLCLLCAGVSFLILELAAMEYRNGLFVYPCLGLVSAAGMLTLVMKPSRRLTVVNALGSAGCGLLAGLSLRFSLTGTDVGVYSIAEPPEAAVMYLLAGGFFAFRGADQLWDMQAEGESKKLRRGFSGKVEDAQSSVAADRERILAEIRGHRQEAAVEHSLHVLFAAGMSTEEIRTAASRHIDIGGAGSWSISLVFIVGVVFVAHPLTHAWRGSSCAGALAWVPWAKAAEGLVWLEIFAYSSPDRRGIAAAAGAKLGAFPYFVVWGAWVMGKLLIGEDPGQANCVPDFLGLALWGPLMLLVSLTGLGGCSVVPSMWRRCVHVLLRHSSMSSHPPEWSSDSGTDLDGTASEA
mmetsp:Transcript_101019/g.290697  ORF Transcript_101019/g.290697 Transcript_101019/m.290697 type:complete len:567 (+) Transcript_101019:59-1759(+)